MVAKKGIVVMGFWVWLGLYKMCPRVLHLSLLKMPTPTAFGIEWRSKGS